MQSGARRVKEIPRFLAIKDYRRDRENSDRGRLAPGMRQSDELNRFFLSRFYQRLREPPAHRRASCVLPSLIQRLQSPSRTDIRPRNPMSEVSDQLPAAAFARARSLHAARKAFISARSSTICLATPLYFSWFL